MARLIDQKYVNGTGCIDLIEIKKGELITDENGYEETSERDVFLVGYDHFIDRKNNKIVLSGYSAYFYDNLEEAKTRLDEW